MSTSHTPLPLLVLLAACFVAHVCAQSPAPAPAPVSPYVWGVDISDKQGPLNQSIWEAAHTGGLEFAIIKASEGLSIINPYFTSQYNSTREAGLLRGSYHVARPDLSDGATQAGFYLSNGGMFNSTDELTLWGTLWLETNPVCTEGTLCSLEDSCYGLDHEQMATWIHDFLILYNATTGAVPFIHTSADWYNSCVGDHGDFSKIAYIWISCVGCPSITTLPYNWTFYIAWQFALEGPFPGNQNVHDETQGEETSAPSPLAPPPSM